MQKLRFYRPAAAAFIVMMAMALTSSGMSFFISPVCADLGFGRGSFTVYYSLLTASGALSNLVLGQYINKKGARSVLLVSAVWCCLCYMLFSVSNALWMFYLAGASIGFFSTSCAILCANVMVQQSYDSKTAAGILGIVMAGSGAGGALFSLIIPSLIESMGWRFTYRFMGFCWLALVSLAWLVLGKPVQVKRGTAAAPAEGVTKADAMKMPSFYLMLVVAFLLGAGCSVQQQMPSLIGAHSFTSAQIGTMMSLATAMMALGKAGQGILYGKIGVSKGALLMLPVFAIGMPLFMFKAAIYPALALTSVGLGTYTTLLPMVTRKVFGSREYAAIWGMIAMAGSAGTFMLNPVWGTIYDNTGAYTLGLVAVPAMVLMGLVTLLMALRKAKN